MGDQYQQGRRSSDITSAQLNTLSDKIDKLQSTADRLIARLDLLILPRVASMNAKADMLLAAETAEPAETTGA